MHCTIKVHATEWYEHFLHSNPILHTIPIWLISNEFQGTQSRAILCMCAIEYGQKSIRYQHKDEVPISTI